MSMCFAPQLRGCRLLLRGTCAGQPIVNWSRSSAKDFRPDRGADRRGYSDDNITAVPGGNFAARSVQREMNTRNAAVGYAIQLEGRATMSNFRKLSQRIATGGSAGAIAL